VAAAPLGGMGSVSESDALRFDFGFIVLAVVVVVAVAVGTATRARRLTSLCLEPELVLPGDLTLAQESAPRERVEEHQHDVGHRTQEIHHFRRRRRRRRFADFTLSASLCFACVDATRHRMTTKQ
jgi:hypothetical protein